MFSYIILYIKNYMLFMIVTNVSLVRKMKVLRKERNSFKCDKIRNRSEDWIHFEGEG